MSKLLPVISTLLLLLTLSAEGFVAWKIHAMSSPDALNVEDSVASETEASPEEVEVVFMDLGETTVNLNGGDADNKFLRVKIIMSLNGNEAQERITTNITKVTDLILNVLSSQAFAYVRTPEGKRTLKIDLIERVNRLVGHNPVRDVFFTDFVSQ